MLKNSYLHENMKRLEIANDRFHLYVYIVHLIVYMKDLIIYMER